MTITIEELIRLKEIELKAEEAMSVLWTVPAYDTAAAELYVQHQLASHAYSSAYNEYSKGIENE